MKKWYFQPRRKRKYITDKKNVLYVKKIIIDDEDAFASNKKYHKVRDHCHYIGKHIGADLFRG